jgi:hypothetical protein
METLIINTHLTYPGWSEGKLNLTLMELAKTFFVERGSSPFLRSASKRSPKTVSYQQF